MTNLDFRIELLRWYRDLLAIQAKPFDKKRATNRISGFLDDLLNSMENPETVCKAQLFCVGFTLAELLDKECYTLTLEELEENLNEEKYNAMVQAVGCVVTHMDKMAAFGNV